MAPNEQTLMTHLNLAIIICHWRPSIINMRRLHLKYMQKLARIIVITRHIGRTLLNSMRRGTLPGDCAIEY